MCIYSYQSLEWNFDTENWNYSLQLLASKLKVWSSPQSFTMSSEHCGCVCLVCVQAWWPWGSSWSSLGGVDVVVVTAIYPGLILADGWCHHCFPSAPLLMVLISMCVLVCETTCIISDLTKSHSTKPKEVIVSVNSSILCVCVCVIMVTYYSFSALQGHFSMTTSNSVSMISQDLSVILHTVKWHRAHNYLW